MDVRLRETTQADAAALARVYAHAVLHGVGTFEETPAPTPRKWSAAVRKPRDTACRTWWRPTPKARCWASRTARRSAPAGATAGRLRPPSTSIPAAQGRGVGARLLGELVSRCEALGLRQLIAVIGGSENAASIGVHARHGFFPAGVLPHVGVKFERWIDVVFMRRDLNGGAENIPSTPGLPLAR